MTQRNSSLFTENALTVHLDYAPYTVRKDHPRYGSLEDIAKMAIKAENEGDVEAASSLWEDFIAVYNGVDRSAAAAVVTASRSVSGLEYRDGNVYFNGTVISNAVVPVIKRYVAEGLDYTSLLNFLSRLLNNPSYRSVEQLWSFVEANGLSVDDEGYILAYKVVKSNYRDKHTGKVDNTPGGPVIECPRNLVNDDPNAACAAGYHVGGWSYSGPEGYFYNQGDKIVVCRIDPADVVSVPHDANAGKVRCCRYWVVADYKFKLPQGVATAEGDEERANSQNDYNTSFCGPRDNVDDALFDGDDDDYDEDEEDEYDNEDEEDDIVSEDLRTGDIIRFYYKGHVRVCEVRSNLYDHLNCRLLKGDKSYDQYSEEYRNFKHDEIEDIEVLN